MHFSFIYLYSIDSMKRKSKKYPILPMIRGKCVEEALRFSIINNDLSIKDIQNYANDMFYLETIKYPSTIIKTLAAPINSIIRTGIITLQDLQINNLLDVNGFKIKNQNKLIDVFPDFIFGNLKVNNIEYEDCCLELKVTNNFNKKLLDRHTEQCINYCLISQKPTILFYLIHDEKNKNLPIQTKPRFYLIK